MDQRIILALFMSTVLAMGFSLIDIADSSAEKTVHFSQDMNDALDCAFAGVEISECSPGLSESSESLRPELIKLDAELNKLTNKTIFARLGDSWKLEFNGNEHVLKVFEITEEQASFGMVDLSDFENTDKFSLKLGQSKIIDIDNNGDFDIKFSLLGITDQTAFLLFELIGDAKMVPLSMPMMYVSIMITIMVYFTLLNSKEIVFSETDRIKSNLFLHRKTYIKCLQRSKDYIRIGIKKKNSTKIKIYDLDLSDGMSVLSNKIKIIYDFGISPTIIDIVKDDENMKKSERK